MCAGVATSLFLNSVRLALKIESSPMPQILLWESSIVSSSVLPDLRQIANGMAVALEELLTRNSNATMYGTVTKRPSSYRMNPTIKIGTLDALPFM